ncbi:ANK_REP_REGION domain-containing protein [Trichoderma simmonsii]|uniref:ANK_REP_REGION domain-containing protein n=1 Tax=Trichoderma simmonsii TaxID=1491479 RepID=A0A8G0PK30_9HYPO|nr:ANK_REP_REGION domain-containing protein [Trichoderma simmonsii]
MDGRSISSLTTLCSGISQRAISGASEIQSLVGGLDSSRQNVSQLLSSLASALQELSQWTTKLETCLVATTVAILVQDGFKELLTSCDGTMTVLHKQLMRLQSDNVERINIDFLVAYYQTVKANISLLESMVDVVQTDDKVEQEDRFSRLKSNDLIVVVETVSETSAGQKNILLDVGESQASGSNSTSNAPDIPQEEEEDESAEPPPYSPQVEAEAETVTEAQSEAPAVAAASSSTPQPSGISWGSVFRNSFKAIANTLVPQPGPFVSALCQAASIGDIQQIAGFLTQGANINGRNENGKNALQCAILADQEDAARLLLASGASTSGSGWSGMPPLFLAASVGNINSAKMFLGRGASIDEKSTSGQYYFVDVVLSGNLDGIRFLLEQGCSANTKNISGEAVIANAIRKKQMALVELLFEFGAKIKSTDISGRNLLAVALDKKDYEMAELLLKKGAKPSAKNLSGMPLLVDEINNRRLKTAKLLLDWGADPNTKDWHSQPVLLIVIKSSKIAAEDKIDMVRQLFAKGAKADVKDCFSKTPAICYAVEAGISEIISLMLQNGAKTTATMQNGDSLLKYAIDHGRKDLTEALLHYGADPNYSVGENGVKPVVQALVKQDLDMVRLLREAGANVNVPEVQDVARALARAEVYEALGMPAPIEGDPPNYDTAMKN